MSYIRTKDGIYEVIKNELGECIKINSANVYGFVMLEDVRLIEENIREAETIPELCDGFYIDVCEPIFEKQFIFPKKEYYKFLYIIEELKKENVKYTAYGFIKTDKGLIYVAKMNEKGELVLI